MSETHYLISDASKKVDVESHVLRYWEEELEMAIPRNEMGHRYYTDFHIRLFKQIKELKEKGYQLKAIKAALAKSLDQDGEAVIPTDVLEEDVVAALKECTDQESREMEKLDDRELTELMAKERAEQGERNAEEFYARLSEGVMQPLSQMRSSLMRKGRLPRAGLLHSILGAEHLLELVVLGHLPLHMDMGMTAAEGVLSAICIL